MLVVDPPQHDPFHPKARGDVGLGLVANGDHMPALVHLPFKTPQERYHHVPLVGIPYLRLPPEMEQTFKGDQWYFLALKASSTPPQPIGGLDPSRKPVFSSVRLSASWWQAEQPPVRYPRTNALSQR
jgi:hypothetical protein